MKVYGILANPAKHSLSPQMHNAAFAALSIQAVYERFEVNDLAGFLEDVRERPISGLSVSLPFKETIIPYLNAVSEEAQEIGAVNTVINEDGFLRGENTDLDGFVRSLSDRRFERAVVFGAGGAARAVVFGLKKMGVKEILIQARDFQKAAELALEFGVLAADVGEVLKGDLFVQTSAIWHSEDFSAIENYLRPENLAGFKLVTDIAYKPLVTPLLLAARAAGVEIVTGEKMLLLQAVRQFELWTGVSAPQEVMGGALNRELKLR